MCVCAHVYGYFWKGHQEFTCYLCTRTVQISVRSSFIYRGCWSKHCFYIFIVYICLRVYIGINMLWCTYGDQSTAYGNWFSPPIIWVLGIELRLLSDLETGSFICRAISLAWKHCFLKFYLFCVFAVVTYLFWVGRTYLSKWTEVREQLSGWDEPHVTPLRQALSCFCYCGKNSRLAGPWRSDFLSPPPISLWYPMDTYNFFVGPGGQPQVTRLEQLVLLSTELAPWTWFVSLRYGLM